MILGFSELINGKQTFFIEKIWASVSYLDLLSAPSIQYHQYKNDYKDKFGGYWDGASAAHKPKLHTIRRGQRYEAGRNIHFAINTRTKNYFQFAPIVKCISVHEIEIKDVTSTKMIGRDVEFGFLLAVPCKSLDEIFHLAYEVYIDDKRLKSDEIEKLAINDGFASVDDFFAYFNEDFTGQIVHWTDLKY